MVLAESDLLMDGSVAAAYVLLLNGGGLEPVGRNGRSVRRLARYDAEAECEYLLSHGGLRGGIAAQ
jgi:hypothetical protein